MLDTSSPPTAVPAQSSEARPLVYRNLMAVALLGAIYGPEEETDKAGKAVENTLKNARQFKAYRALAQSMGGHGADAVKAMAAHLEQNPDDDGARIAMAVAMKLSGNAQWKHVLDGVFASSGDQGVREAAAGLLEYFGKN